MASHPCRKKKERGEGWAPGFQASQFEGGNQGEDTRGHPAWRDGLFDLLWGPVLRVLLERSDCAGFVVVDVEDGIELCELEQVVDLLGQLEELHSGTLIFGGGECSHQLAQA